MKKKIYIVIIVILLLAIATTGCDKRLDHGDETETETETTDYTALIVAGNQWNELHTDLIYEQTPVVEQYEHTFITKIFDETVTIDSLLYYKVYTANDSLSENWLFMGLIREDVAGKKVYFKPENKPELLLYNFSMNVGDEFKTYNFHNQSNQEVVVKAVEVDSIFIESHWRKRIFVQSKCDIFITNHTWIEGIGGLTGLLNSTVPIELLIINEDDRISLSCFWGDNGFIYKTSERECFVWKNIPYNPYCNFDNPLTDLPWLKQLTDAYDASSTTQKVIIATCIYQVDKTGFLFSSCSGCPDWGMNLYDCEGHNICLIWGESGGYCPEYEIDFASIQQIYQLN